MNKVLFVGDSHLARVEVEFHKLDDKLIEADFVCAPSPIASKLFVDNGNLCINFCDENTFSKHRLADKHDFYSWYTKVVDRITTISQNGKIEFGKYDAVVFLSFQMMNAEIWANTRLNEKLGIFSSACSRSYYEETFRLNHARLLSEHFILLEQLKSSNCAGFTVFSAPTPLISSESNLAKSFPCSILNDYPDFFSDIQSFYANAILKNYGSYLISYPEELISDNLMSTKSCYQHGATDFTHINNHASKIWLLHLIEAVIKKV